VFEAKIITVMSPNSFVNFMGRRLSP